MLSEDRIQPPLHFNSMKHHLGFIKEYIGDNLRTEGQTVKLSVIKDLKHLGGSVMDIYTGSLSQEEVIVEILKFLNAGNLIGKELFKQWTGDDPEDFKTVKLSDGSQWILKYFKNELRYVHVFPSRYSPHSFRVKANTLKSAILYIIWIGKDFVNEEDLNRARALSGLSPLKDIIEAEAITEMIEILRG
jgi:hypothetical protein